MAFCCSVYVVRVRLAYTGSVILRRRNKVAVFGGGRRHQAPLSVTGPPRNPSVASFTVQLWFWTILGRPLRARRLAVPAINDMYWE